MEFVPEQLPLRRSFKYLSVSFILFFSLTICLLLTASLNEPKLLGYIINCLAKLIKIIVNEKYFMQNQRKNCEKGDFLVKTVRYIYFLEI